MKAPLLLPCPFCGGPAGEENNLHPLAYPKAPTEYFILCTNQDRTCSAAVLFVGPCSTFVEAARRWNTRAKPPA